MPSLPNIKAYSGNGNYIFVSYSHRDKSIAYPFIAALQKKYNVWFDEGIHYGREWEEEISNKLKHCTAFFFIVSETSLKSVNCKDELYHARELEKNFLNILTDGTIKLPDWFSFRYGRYQMCKLFAFPTVESALEDLERKCEWFTDLGKDVADVADPDRTVEPEETILETLTIGADNSTVAPLLKRAFFFLEDGDWRKADDYCERVLDQDPENAQAYLGKLMAELQVSHQTELANCEQPFDNRDNYKKAVRFGGDQMALILSGYITQINERNDNIRKTEILKAAIAAMKKANSADEFVAVAKRLKMIPGFQNSDALAEQCIKKSEYLETKLRYDNLVSAMKSAKTADEFKAVAMSFKSLSGFLDADSLAQQCLVKAEEWEQSKYKEAVAKMNAARTESAYKKVAALFQQISGFRNADTLAEECLKKAEYLAAATIEYDEAVSAMNKAKTADEFQAAAELFKKISGFRRADALAERCLKLKKYDEAVSVMNKAKTVDAFKAAAELFKKISGFREADAFALRCLKVAEQKEAQAVLRAFKKGFSPKSSPTLEERLAEAKTKVGYLEHILSVFDTTQSQIRVLQNDYNALVTQEKQLADQRSRLGLFAGKEKKRIDGELASVSAKKSDLEARIEQNQKTLGEYSSAADVERDLNEARNGVKDLEAQIESLRESADVEYSFEEALNIYLEQPDIAAAVDIIYPKTSLKLALYGKVNTIKFGRYVQELGEDPKPVEWLVLVKKDEKALVISKYALDCQQYNTSYTSVTWETCSLRKWLNGTFLSAAFSSEEQRIIISSTVTSDKNPSYSSSPGNNTTDKVFLLSITEVNKYFSSNGARECAPTFYAVAQGAYRSISYTTSFGKAWWWLRSPGYDSDRAAGVSYDGSVNDRGHNVNRSSAAVRPALWIDLCS